jgi:uncharacterized protein (DUF2141 family)
MKTPIFFLFMIIGLIKITAQALPVVGTLNVNINNVKHHEGHIRVSLQNRSNFLTGQSITYNDINATSDSVQMAFKNLPVGEYAVAIYQDINSNNDFDRNFIGYPKEPFAVSNNLRPLKMLLPSFDAAKVVLQNMGETVNITLLNN